MKSKIKGFTLVEMAIVVFLIGILGMVAIPNMKMIYKQEAKRAAHSLCLDLVNIRKQALITGDTYTLTLNEVSSPNQSQYTLSPGLPLGAESVLKTIEVGNNAHISYERKDQVAREIIFEGRKIEDIAEKEQIELIIIVRYDGEAYVEITFEMLTGKYTMRSMK